MKQSNIKNNSWYDIDFEKTEKLLFSSNIKKIIPLYEYLNIPDRQFNPTPFLLFLENDLKAVFKPNRYFPRIHSALMAYRFSQFMNFKLVPPTITRTINGKKSLVRFFIEKTDCLQDKFTKNLTPVETSDIYTFYFVLGEWDANKYNVLFETSSGKPVLIDNETSMTASFIPYGDYPFRSFKIKNLNLSIASPEEYENFPCNEIKKLNNYSMAYLQKIFYDMTETEFNNYFMPWCFERLNFLNDGNMYFVRWNNAYWIKHNFTYYTEIFRNFLPTVFSKKTIDKLQKLNHDIITSFLPDSSIQETIISGILYRRGILLKEAFKLNNFYS